MGQLWQYVYILVVLVCQVKGFEEESDLITDYGGTQRDDDSGGFDAAPSRYGAFLSPQRPAFCYYNPDRGSCTGRYPRYYYDFATNTCMFFIYSGCGGNQNKFHTITTCMTVCKAYYNFYE